MHNDAPSQPHCPIGGALVDDTHWSLTLTPYGELQTFRRIVSISAILGRISVILGRILAHDLHLLYHLTGVLSVATELGAAPPLGVSPHASGPAGQ